METQAWRIPYLEEKIHEQFRTHIYGWVSRAPGGGGSWSQIPHHPKLTFLHVLTQIDLGRSGGGRQEIEHQQRWPHPCHHLCRWQCAPLRLDGQTCKDPCRRSVLFIKFSSILYIIQNPDQNEFFTMIDMNPCQGHILELKLAAIQALEYNDFWLIFGEGRHPEFDKLLTTKLSPFLSS